MFKITAQNIKFYGSWSSSKFPNFETNTWFFKNNRALPNFLYMIFNKSVHEKRILDKPHKPL